MKVHMVVGRPGQSIGLNCTYKASSTDTEYSVCSPSIFILYVLNTPELALLSVDNTRAYLNRSRDIT